MFKKLSIKLVVIVTILSLAAVFAWTHSGGLDQNGGHWDRKKGTYHYHRPKPSATIKPTQQRVRPVGDSLQKDVQVLKKQVAALSLENKRLKSNIQDLYFMTEPLRVQVIDKEEGRFYYAKSGKDMYGMLPSESSRAELYYQLRSAENLGWTKNKIKELSDRFLQTPKNPYIGSYESEFTFGKGELRYHPDLKTYLEIVD